MTRIQELKQCIAASGKSPRSFALEELGVSPQYFYDVLHGRRPIGGKIKAYLDDRTTSQRPSAGKNNG